MLAAAMLITVFPFSAAADSDQHAETPSADISVNWELQEETTEESAAVKLSASLDADSEVQSATVNIKLSAEEAGALTTTFSEDSAVKLLSPEDQLALLNDGITPITEEEADDDEPEEPAVVEEETDDNKAEESDTTNGQDETNVDETDESGDDVVQDEAGADDPEGSDAVDEGEETAVEETEDSITDSGEEEADNDDPEGSDTDAGQDDAGADDPEGSGDDVVQNEAGADDPEEPVSETTLISLDQSKTAQMADSEQYWLLTFTLSQPEEETTNPTVADEGTDPAASAASGEATDPSAPAAAATIEEGETADPSKVTANLTFTLPEGATEGLTIDIATTDIEITATDESGNKVEEFTKDIDSLELTLEPEPVPTFPESDQSATIPASGAIPDLSYTLSLDGVEDIDYWLQLTLPEGLALPAGTPTAEETANGTNIVMSDARTAEDGQTAQPEDNVLATVTGLPEGVEINDISVGENTEGQSTLTFRLYKEPSTEEEEADEPNPIERIVTALFRSADAVTITLKGDKLQRSTANEIKGNATLALYDGAPSGDVEPLNKTSIDITSEILQSEDEVVTDETEYREEFRKTIIWVDGGEATGRPDMKELFLSFASFKLDGTTYTLNAQTMGLLGLTALPELTVTSIGTNQYTVSYGANTLPSKITTTDEYGYSTTYEVDWTFTPPTVPGYLVESEDSEGEDDTTWYYIHETKFEVTLNLLDGDRDYHLRENWDKIANTVLSSFALYTQTGENSYTAVQLSKLYEEGKLVATPNENGTVTLTISGLPMYETSGARINYSIDLYKTDESGAPITTPPEGAPNEDDNIKLNVSEDPNDTNDSFSVSYNNDHAGGTTTAPDQVYSGGTINLQLTGTTHYSATKQWWDEYTGKDASEENREERPDGEFQLWRYIKGQGVETAEPVRDNGAIVKLKIDKTDTQELVFTLGDETTKEDILPKYNGEGYEYIYVVREYLDDSSGYRQIFGKVEQETDGSLKITDTLPDGVTREGNNDFVYNDGTLTNTISEYVTVTANKTWDAAVYQSMLEDVEVTLTLQSRPKVTGNEGEYDWVNTNIERELTGFDAESLDARSVSVSMPKYDAQGRELEYRWVESEVQVGESDPVTVQDDKFTITLDDEQVEFISEADPQSGDGTFTTNIKNKIRDTITYDFTKKWADDTDPKKVYFAIYQYVGEMKNEPYIIFSMDGTNVEIIKPEGQDGDHDGISIKEGSVASKEPSGDLKAEWHVTLENLPEFDEDGRRYEYLSLEGSSEKGPWHVNPSLQSSRNETGYTSEITNGKEGGQAIVVQKVWADDSDVEHRSPVTIQVYNATTNQEIRGAKVTLGETDKNGEQIWTGIVSIGENDPGNVYVLETQVGETNIHYESPQNPTSEGFVSPEYETSYHRYRVLYDKQTIGATNVFTVTNQRLGNVDVTVEKTWNVGDGEKLKAVIEALKALENPPRLVLQLEFDPNYVDEGNTSYDIDDENGNGYVQLVKDQKVLIKSPGSAENENDENEWQSVSYRQELLSADMFGTKEGQINTEEEKWVASLPQTIYFWNLPKYNADGEVVRYTVKELWVKPDSQEVTDEEWGDTYAALATAYAEFTSTITETGYIAIGEEDGEDGEESSTNRDEFNDKHDFSCVNSLSGTKDVEWHKLWKDQYASDASLRPDLYLDIYQVGYRSANANEPTAKRITQNYRWYDVTKAPSGDEGNGDYGSADDDDSPEVEGEEIDPNHWRAEIQGVPKYDAKGYEYYYYAVEHTSVDYDAIDYYDGQYYYASSDETDELQYVGGKDGPDGDASGEDGTNTATRGDWVYPVAKESQDSDTPDVYGLLENGTFQNGLEGDAVLSAAKQWNSLPEGWPSGQLPTVEFTLYRYPQGGGFGSGAGVCHADDR